MKGKASKTAKCDEETPRKEMAEGGDLLGCQKSKVSGRTGSGWRKKGRPRLEKDSKSVQRQSKGDHITSEA